MGLLIFPQSRRQHRKPGACHFRRVLYFQTRMLFIIGTQRKRGRPAAMQQASLRVQELNPARLSFLYRKQFELSKVQRGETIAIVSDLGTRREYIQAAFAAADELGADTYEMCVNSIPGWTRVGVPTIGQCKGTLEALSCADLIVIFHVPLFSRWLKTVMDKKVRVLMIIDAPDDLDQLMSPSGLKEALKYADSVYAKTKKVRVVSEAG